MRDLFVATAALLAGCASAGIPPASRDAAPLFRTAAVSVPAAQPPVAIDPAKGAKDGVSIEVRFETSKGVTVIAPRITAFLGGRANIQVADQTSYIADFDVERGQDAAVMDPIIGIANDGIYLEVTARAGTKGTALAWFLRTARLKKPLGVESFDDLHGHRLSLQLPTWERAEAEGVRGMDDGVWGLLARLPGGNGETVSVMARVAPEKLEFTSKDEDARDIALIDPSAERPRDFGDPVAGENTLPARAARAALPESPRGTLELRAVTVASDLPAGSVVEADGAALGTALPLDPGSLQWVTGLVPGARAASLLDETFVKDWDMETGMGGLITKDPIIGSHVSGLTAVVEEDGGLALSWTTTAWNRFTTTPGFDSPISLDVPDGSTWKARVVPGAAARLVVLAPLKDGRVAAVLVRFRPE